MTYKDQNIRDLFSHTFLWQLLLCIAVLYCPCSTFNTVHAQPNIKGNVYGGGRQGDTGGNATVTVYAVDLDGSVFGGARQADVGGSAFVHVDGQNMSDDILINKIYGGNDIAGTIGASMNKTTSTIPDELTEAVANGITDDETGDGGGKNKKNKNGYSAFVLTTKERTVTGSGDNPETTQPYKIFIGQLFGGGNGDYTYTKDGNDFIVKRISDNEEVARSSHDFVKPDIAKTYIEMRGGTCAILYGGGNAVTVTNSTDICIDNASTITTQIYDRDADGNEIKEEAKNKLSEETERGRNRLKRMGIYKIGGESYVDRPDYQFSRVFGGNNKAPMAIRPTWHLKQGLIRNLYSGGNKGAMTYPNGIYLHIKEETNPKEGFMGLTVGNVYGGCRMADVNPVKNTIVQDTIEGIVLPAGFAARVTIAGGNIGNVYGGNDVSGTVYGGCAVGIHSSVNGDVYGGGNGSYAYTDKSALVEDPESESAYLYGDFYYNPEEILEKAKISESDPGMKSVKALNLFRPNAEKVTVRLISDDADKPTIIRGSVYCGGNSATLRSSDGDATAELKIGSYVRANNVFLGNNGENMVKERILTLLADNSFSTIDLKNSAQMAEYMKGCEMGIRPDVVFDQEYDGLPGHTGYIPYSTYIGSLYCGGNVGSVNIDHMNTFNFNQTFVIFDKLVGGCNSANVPVKYDGGTKLNAAYNGGLITDPDPAPGPTPKDKLTLNLSNLKIQPMRWNDEYEAVASGTTLTRENTYYTSIYGAGKFTSDGTEEADGTNYFVLKTAGTDLIWNTVDENGDPTPPVTSGPEEEEVASKADLNRRFKGGNVYGGCYSSGHIEGNVIINIDKTLMDPNALFDEIWEDDNSLYGQDILTKESYHIKTRRSGVILGQQGMDVLGTALNIFGGGKGKGTEIWGSTTINMNGGYVFQVFGGSEEGAIGKGEIYTDDPNELKPDNTYEGNDYYFNGKRYANNDKYSCTVNLKGKYDGVPKSVTANADMSECEFIYGGGFLGPICGNTTINLGKGRIFNSFAGSCNADILGHTETYMGRQIKDDGSEGEGFPYVRDYIYGGNDLGGRILGTKDFSDRVRSDVSGMTYSTTAMIASAYTEYQQGRALGIFGGCFGTYDYTDPEYKDYFYTTGSVGQTDDNLGTARPGYTKPRMDNAFVNFRPTLTDVLKSKETNTINEIYGAGEGYPGDGDRDKMQKSSYILIDIPQEMENYKKMEVWGAGAWSGLGMENHVDPKAQASLTDEDKNALDAVSAIIDLPRGKIAAAYGGSYQEGITRRTVVNVPSGSTIQIGCIFGGAYGTNTYMPCDVYESNVNWNSANAEISTAIYGGNNNERRTVYAHINVNAPVYSNIEKSTLGQVFGAGCGGNTWSEYTEVNLNAGAKVKEVYGGGQAGKVHNAESVQYYMNLSTPTYKWPKGYARAGQDLTDDEWEAAWKLGGGYDPVIPENASVEVKNNAYWQNNNTNLANPLARTAEMDDRDFTELTDDDKELVQNKYSTNVIIRKGAEVTEYAYGGGLGTEAIVSGTTYIALLGGTVKKDIYAAGTSGSIQDMHGAQDYSESNRAGFMASANAYIAGGTCRNVYGGGWKGSVGRHMKKVTVDDKDVEIEAGIIDPNDKDVLAEAHVVIGIRKDQSNLLAEIQKVLGSTATLEDYGFYCGVPTIQRNAYGGGEGGAIWGTANITLNNGYIGYVFSKDEPTDKTLPYIHVDGIGYYQEKLNDETWSDGKGLLRLYDSGNIFGGGYIDNSTVDRTSVTMMGGTVRGCLFGGGEIAAIGRGIIDASGENNSVRTLHGIYKAGHTSVKLYEGHVHRNVFGGGRGYNNLGETGTLYSDGYVFGQTEVNIFGGEVGTDEELAKGNGNVFGGGDIGYVYSAYEEDGKLYVGIKDGERYDNKYEGYYYAYDLEQNLAPENYIPYIPANFVYDEHDPKWVKIGGEYILTEDTKVLIEPWCKVISQVKNEQEEYVNVTINGHEYAVGAYVPTDDLQYLENKNADAGRWGCLDDKGIIIHNAVFAGGNTSAGSSMVFANATSIFGNSTASIHDVFHRDLITVGTGHTGGLYGDGNLTFVDGYRGLNITNYGTDYYFTKPEISIETYRALPAREAAYYELRYQCKISCKDKDDTQYTAGTIVNGILTGGSTISADDLNTLFQDVYFNSSNETERYDTNPGDGWTPMLNANGTPNATFWEENGVCSRYAGRLMNTIQRADFCGVFGSRMVMEGAQDRVPEIVDHTNYTINRVREVSLNQQHSKIASDLTLVSGATPAANVEDQNPYDYADMNKAVHGNYFGIFGIVNYLGALTSDVHFMPDKDVRVTDNTDAAKYKCASQPYSNGGTNVEAENYETASYYDWKAGFVNDRRRNNATSLNKVALASGVYLELTTEKSTGDGLYEKDWGYITGVIELDLINVQPGIGGGFVYAKNVHKVGTYDKKNHVTLTKLNKDAITQKDFVYNGTDVEWETSGNFVHSTQTIIDDCYNVSNKYQGDGAMPAHYWYIQGSVYVYDQYISAYTGAPNAYSETVEIPLTITAASHGTMKLLNVMPNKYAYYSSTDVPLENDKRVIINDVTYYKNDPISYWDWFLLSKSERELFVDDTYVVIADCKIGNKEYKEGTVLLPSEYNAIRGNNSTPPEVLKKVDNNDGTTTWEPKADFTFDFVFRQTNNLRHDTGYLLTYEVNNPTKWDKWYTEFDSSGHSTHVKQQTAADGFNSGPTYYLTNGTGEVLGQREYEESNIISKDVYDTYQAIVNKPSSKKQATFEPAYIVTQKVTVNDGATNHHWYEGSLVSQTYMSNHGMTASTAPAYICTSTIQLSNTEFIYLDTKMTETDKNAYITRVTDEIDVILEATEHEYDLITKLSDLTEDQLSGLSAMKKNRLSSLLLARNDIKTNIVPAYYCTEAGLYGGNYYEGGKNYRGLEAWSSMSPEDRSKFTFNYDALDLFIDSHYTHPEGQKYQYDSSAGDLDGAEANLAGYSLIEPIEYTATYNGDDPLQYTTDGGASATATKAAATELSRTEYERLPNEKRHYSSLKVEAAGTYYVVNAPFQVGSTTYAAGNTISESAYISLLSEDQAHITRLKFEESQTGTYYFCREAYTIDNVEGNAVTSLMTTGSGIDEGKMVKAPTGTSISTGSNVPIGTVISKDDYDKLVNKQKDFTIHGKSPTETSTLYVSRNSDIYDLSEDKIITVIYQYDYEESDSEGNIVPVSERHVVNIHLQFKSGIPLVEDIREPELILPGDNVALREPHVTPGAYEIMGGGWELFDNIDDAERHTNGIPYAPNLKPLYWYQDGYYVAYYALTYLGKTYSNHVPVSVANYHDLQLVLGDKDHHYYVDNPNVKRDSKIYINDYTTSDPATSQNGLDLLKDLFTLSTGGTLTGHSGLNTSQVGGCKNLEFFLRTDLDHSGSPWTPIGTDNSTKCFDGMLHGDGHTINGLNASLFGHLCGEVYNLGVTGTFISAGIADEGTGYMENCWVNGGTAGTGVKALFNNPEDTPKRTVHLVNCYYPNTKGYTVQTGTTPKEEKAFYNGEVTYDLNEFYLFKRYSDNNTSTINDNENKYYYWKDVNGVLTTQSGYYPNVEGPYLVNDQKGDYIGSYVESRFADGDFIYAGGNIPETPNERLYTYQEGNNTITAYYPIWPDDYLFFGQKLTYGHVEEQTHQPQPSIINKDNERLLTTEESNRVYRAPAYFRSKTMKAVHFNPDAVFAQSKKDDASVIAYKDMTAIDFTGGNGDLSGGYKKGLSGNSFYPPLLDDDGLTDFTNVDLTRNLLVYTEAPGGTGSNETPTAAQQTANVVSTYLQDGPYEETNANYHTVDPWDSFSDAVKGHWVKHDGESYIATRDHLLVDKQDFNAPISYEFENTTDNKHRMWYQRTPDHYVTASWDATGNRTTKGWDGVSLPFKVDIVTTQTKGELTHFYEGSDTGHEYWLRQYTGGKTSSTDPEVFEAILINSDPNNADGVKEYTNTFLWDYYYSYSNNNNDSEGRGDDKNTDDYQKYYNSSHTYNNYPRQVAGKPYLVGFPGATYYEFDLSGNFKPQNTATPAPDDLTVAQIITFASAPGTTIGVSDNEIDGNKSTAKGYTFKPSYLNETFAAGTADTYTLNEEGSSYDIIPSAAVPPADPVPYTKVSAFRPYFIKSGGSGSRQFTRSIVFSDEQSKMGDGDRDLGDKQAGTLKIYPKRKMIVVTSSLPHAVDVRIVNTAGITHAAFTVEPGETVETRVNSSGIYIVHTSDARYTKKLAVK